MPDDREGQYAEVTELPACDICKRNDFGQTPVDDLPRAHFDGACRGVGAAWAYMCGIHFSLYGIGLGTGVGQRLILLPEQEKVELSEAMKRHPAGKGRVQ